MKRICWRTHRDGAAIEVREVVIPLRDPQQNLLAFGVMMHPPAGPGSAGEAPAVDAGRSAAARPLSQSRRKVAKLLVVDDDDTIRTIAEQMLQDLGYEVLAAASGAEALDILGRDKSIDLLFTDVIMPGMDGGELAERARLMRPDLKILFTSGYFEHALIQKGTISQNADLLVKPYQGNALARKIEMMLAKRRQRPGRAFIGRPVEASPHPLRLLCPSRLQPPTPGVTMPPGEPAHEVRWI